MNRRQQERLGKFLSLVLRHEPSAANIRLERAGWVRIDTLLQGCQDVGVCLSREELSTLVEIDRKGRFAYSADGERIRANQGHSVPVELGHPQTLPPSTLFHGTYVAALASIRSSGLRKMGRHHVHLSSDPSDAAKVGARRGRACVLCIASGTMADDGYVFFLSDNGVWLTEEVPHQYLVIPVS